MNNISRRDFVKTSALSGAGFFIFPSLNKEGKKEILLPEQIDDIKISSQQYLDLAPAEWIWYPSERTLQNTMILFRRKIVITKKIRSASGWILADSRYVFYVNEKRIQFGPAPSDPRWIEVDPLELTNNLTSGENVFGAQVLFYGSGDGTSPIGKPGFLFYLKIEFEDGTNEIVVSNGEWKSYLPKSWKAGQYKRWYLRSFQEDFDARKFPYGWLNKSFRENNDWLAAMKLDCPPDKPSICSYYYEYIYETWGNRKISYLTPRSIPLMNEETVSGFKLAEAYQILWKRPPEEYFDYLVPDSFTRGKEVSVNKVQDEFQLTLNENETAVLTFELDEQVVGWPKFTVDAPEGTIIEMMVHEAHKAGGPVLLNSHFNSWTRFICKEGVNNFSVFDFESFRWIQLHIRNGGGKITLSNLNVIRRVYPWQNKHNIILSDAALQKLMDACINTLKNSAQETIVDGMARERQQYSGDGGHQLHALYYSFGETKQQARFIKTFSQGQTPDGYFLDCWPAYDRLARLMERQLQLTDWGPLLDHGIGFNFDCYYYYLYTGNLEALEEAFPRLIKFFYYLKSIIREDGLLPVENTGLPSVWIDHEAFRQQRHKQCSFNLYASAMMLNALATLCHSFKKFKIEEDVKQTGKNILNAAVKKFWSDDKKLFVDNLPWLQEENEIRLSDRTLATAILFDQCPGADSNSIKTLADAPEELGISYPPNAIWRYWALAKSGKMEVVVDDFRKRWATMDSVLLNNTIQEGWKSLPDNWSQWSHCGVVPLIILFQGIAGIMPLEPGFNSYKIYPQLADMGKIELTAYTVKGEIAFSSSGKFGNRELKIKTLPNAKGELIISDKEKTDLPVIRRFGKKIACALPENKEVKISLNFT